MKGEGKEHRREREGRRRAREPEGEVRTGGRRGRGTRESKALETIVSSLLV